MKQRLILLNLLLLALVALAGWQLRERWVAARAAEKKILSEQATPVILPPVTPPPPAPAVTAANYMEVASRTLFSPDRNPDVVKEVPPAPVMPALPFVHGMMTIEGKTIIIMSVKAGAPHHGYSPGDTIGDFQFVSVHGNVLTFDWNGEKVVRNFDDMREKNPTPVAQNAPPVANAPAPTTTIEVVQSSKGPGPKDEATGTKNCVANDNTPAGTVQDGFKKVVQTTPFGPGCRWEPVK